MGKFNIFGMIGGVSQLISFTQQVKGLSPAPAPTYHAPPIQETDPMEGMADAQELEQYSYKRGAFYLGNIHPDHGVNFKAGVSDDRHVFLVAGNAGGKGRAILINNSLRWAGGYVALDLKGENCSITAMRRGKEANAKGTGTSVRRFLGQEVVALDPFDQVEGASRIYKRAYNPLFDIDIHSRDAQAQIKKIASACIVPYEGSNSWISDNAETILAGVIEAVLLTKEKHEQNLQTVRLLIFNLARLVDELFNDERLPIGGLSAEANGVLDESLESDEIGYYKSCLSQNLKWLSEPQMQEHLDNDDFSLKKIVQGGGSVYICVPPNRVDDFKCWLRIIIQTCLNAKIEMGVYQETIPTLFNLDEFPLLGAFKEVEKNAGFIRGYNCKLVFTIQNIGQIKQHYAKNWETFLGNAGAIIGFATNDLETEQYLSDRMGKILAWETSYSLNSGTSGQALGGAGHSDSRGVSQGRRERAVRLPNEIHQQGARENMRGFVISSGAPFMIERCNYDDIKTGGLYDSPEHIRQWEANFKNKI